MSSNGFCCPNGSQSENKRKQKTDTFLDLTKELKKLWNLTVTSIVVDAFETVRKCFERRQVKFGSR